MKLKKAIQRAALFTTKEGPLSGIRLVPAVWRPGQQEHWAKALVEHGIVDAEDAHEAAYHLLAQGHFADGARIAFPHFPAYALATDGVVAMMILLDPDVVVPNCVVNAVAAKKAVTELKDAFTVTSTGKASVMIEGATGQFHCLGVPVEDYPSLPPFPTVLRSVPLWDLVDRVVHAASNRDDRPELQCVHLTPEFVEATDQDRVARVPLSGIVEKGLLVPKKLFEKWPTKRRCSVGFAVEHGNVYVHVDEEFRFARAVEDKDYYNLTPLFPKHMGYEATVERLRLRVNVRSALGATKLGWVELHFANNQLRVSGIDNERVGFSDVFEAPLQKGDPLKPITLVVNGHYLMDTIDAVGDQHLTLLFTSEQQPLRIEASHFTESIWPLFKTPLPTTEANA